MNNHISIRINQEPFVDALLQRTNLHHPSIKSTPSPYRSGYPVDKIPMPTTLPSNQNDLNLRLQQLTGCLQWLSVSTRPDIATITNILSKYNHSATEEHIKAIHHVIRYLKGTKTLGIIFDSQHHSKLHAFVKFPISATVTPFSDANWGPQDQS